MLSKNASLEEFRAVVLSANDDVLAQFEAHFSVELDDTYRALHRSYCSFRALESIAPKTKRASAVQIFSFQAIDSVVSSTALLIRGWAVPSGNLMRQYTEAVATALLFSHPAIEAFSSWLRSPQTYSFDTSPQLLLRRRNRQLLGVDHLAWQTYIRLTRWYSSLSHATNEAVGANMHFHTPHVALSGSFDPGKVDYYRVELRRRASGADSLAHMLDVVRARASDLAL